MCRMEKDTELTTNESQSTALVVSSNTQQIPFSCIYNVYVQSRNARIFSHLRNTQSKTSHHFIRYSFGCVRSASHSVRCIEGNTVTDYSGYASSYHFGLLNNLLCLFVSFFNNFNSNKNSNSFSATHEK